MLTHGKDNYFNDLLEDSTLQQRLKIIADSCNYPVFTTSLGREDQFLTWAIYNDRLPIKSVTLQTQRLFPETLTLLAVTRDRYGIEIEEFEPIQADVSTYVGQNGKDGFYNSIQARKACCSIRKVEPLTRALRQADGWITGLTRYQSDGRNQLPFAQWDEQHLLMKFNPLADFTQEAIEAAIIAHEIPVNPLHSKGYSSIGCEPCTRAIRPGEHVRSGRWWWEQDASTECGLHQPQSGPIQSPATRPANI